MADDVGGWHSLFNKNVGKLYVGLCVFEEPLKYKETPVYWKKNTTKNIN